MLNGNVFELRTRGHHTDASACFVLLGAHNWPTPVKMDFNERWKMLPSCRSGSVVRQAHFWHTPLKTDSKFCLRTGKFSSVVSQALDFSDGAFTNRLNPEWAETLMGWPVGWTSTDPLQSNFPGFPMPQGVAQHDYEPPRVVHKDVFGKQRAKRIAMVGNGVVRHQAALAYRRILRTCLPDHLDPVAAPAALL